MPIFPEQNQQRRQARRCARNNSSDQMISIAVKDNKQATMERKRRLFRAVLDEQLELADGLEKGTAKQN